MKREWSHLVFQMWKSQDKIHSGCWYYGWQLHLPNKAQLNLTTKCIDKSNTLPIPVAKYMCFSRELRKCYLQDEGIGKDEMRTENGHQSKYVNFPRSARKSHLYDYEYIKNHLHDFQALLTFLVRYLLAFIAPTARRPDTACLALETITLRLRILCKELAASSLKLLWVSFMALPEIIIPFFHNLTHITIKWLSCKIPPSPFLWFGPKQY